MCVVDLLLSSFVVVVGSNGHNKFESLLSTAPQYNNNNNKILGAAKSQEVHKAETENGLENQRNHLIFNWIK